MRLIKAKPRYHCDFCSHTATKAAMEAHERICWKNPNRYCESCENKGYYPADYYSGHNQEEPCYYCNQLTRDSDAAKVQAKLAQRLPKEEVA